MWCHQQSFIPESFQSNKRDHLRQNQLIFGVRVSRRSNLDFKKSDVFGGGEMSAGDMWF